MKLRVHALVSGCVQGVCYRVFTWEKAIDLRVTGWVRNLSDGCVEAVLEGEIEAVNQLVEELKIGPVHARVSGVEVQFQDAQNQYTDFTVKA